ncbi:MAG: hypothetical protein ACREMN_05870, partial [Gemmatimonadales bacterium]
MIGRAALGVAAVAAGVGGVSGVVTPAALRAQEAVRPDHTAAMLADSLRLAGRPWHAAETLLAAARRISDPNAFLLVEAAKAEVNARRYDRAYALLAARPWLSAYRDGEAVAVLAEAEYGLERYIDAARHFVAARERAEQGPGSPRAALLAVRAGVAYEAAGQADSAAAAFAAARGGGLGGIDGWLRVRQARVTRDTGAAFRLLNDGPLPPAAARHAQLARARALLVAGDTGRAIAAFAEAGKGLEVARLALGARDSVRARAALYELLQRAPLSDDGAAAVPLAQGSLPPRTAAEH